MQRGVGTFSCRRFRPVDGLFVALSLLNPSFALAPQSRFADVNGRQADLPRSPAEGQFPSCLSARLCRNQPYVLR